MVVISFVSKDNEGNQNLLVKDRQAGHAIFLSHKSIVGAGLPAIAVCQATSLLNVRPLSQASQLPQE
ncbi:hypothetical protein PflCFBP13517_09485 [Pseudomonas fluorescens]|nr:hypothetical protein PflCFBP13517_09485 [Pseudomonas fluorescens]